MKEIRKKKDKKWKKKKDNMVYEGVVTPTTAYWGEKVAPHHDQIRKREKR